MRFQRFAGMLLFLILISSHGYSQNAEVSWGEMIPLPGLDRKSNEAALLDADEDYYYVRQRDKNGEQLLKFNYQHELLFAIEMQERYPDRDLRIQSMIATSAGRFLILTEEPDFTNLTVTHVAEVEGDLLGPLRKIVESTYRGLNLIKSFSTEDFSIGPLIQESPSRQMVAFAVPGEVKGDQVENYNVLVFDQNLNLLWNQQYDVEEYKDFQVNQLEVLDSGQVFLLSRHKLDREARSSQGGSTQEIQLTATGWDASGQELFDYPVRLSSTHLAVEAGMISRPDDNKLVIIGFGRIDTKGTLPQSGVYRQILDIDDGAVLSTDYWEHNESVLGEHIGVSNADVPAMFRKRVQKASGGEVRYPDFLIRQLVSFGQGGYGLLGENIGQSSAQSTTAVSGGRLLLLFFQPDGDDLFPVVADRLYLTTFPASLSCVAGYGPQGAYLVYNDNKTREERRELDKVGFEAENLTTDLQWFSYEGESLGNMPLFNFEEEMLFYPSASLETDRGMLLYRQEKSNKAYQIGFLSFE